MIAVWNELASNWAQTFGFVVLQNTVFLALVVLALRLLRDAPARTRHAIGLVGLVKLVLPPLLPLTWPAAGGGDAGAVAGVFAPLGLGGGNGAGLPVAAVPGLGLPGVLAGALLVWAAGAAVVLIASVAATVRLALRLEGAAEVPATELPHALPPGVTVHRTRRIALPLTLGPWPRRIYVPEAWDHWSDDCRALTLRHELAHLDRRDGLWQALQLVVRALYFFHPLVWWLDREIDATREMAVDDAAAGEDRDARVTYTRHLVDIAESLACAQESCGTAAALFRRRRELLGRVRYQLEKGDTIMKTWTRRAVLTTVVLMVVAVPLSWHLSAAEADTEKPAAAGEELRAAGDPVPSPPPKSENLELKVKVDRDGKVTFEGDKLALVDFEDKITAQIGPDRDDVVVTIVCEDGVTMGEIHLVSEVLRQVWPSPKVRFVDAQGRPQSLNVPPRQAVEKLAQLDPDDRVDVFVGAKGKAVFAGQKIPVEKVGKMTEKALQENPLLVVAISFDEETPYEDFTHALDQLKKAGAERIAVLPPKKKVKIKTAAH